MKTVVCFGDSNTWGSDPETPGGRHPINKRYPGILQKLLGEDYLVREEGLSGRTTAFDDPIEPYRNGLKAIDYCMLTHMPVDLLVVMLGTNDLKRHHHQNAFSSSKGLEQIVLRAQNKEYGVNGVPPKILIVSPIHVAPNIEEVWTRDYIDSRGRETGLELAGYYKKTAHINGCYFMDAAQFASPSPRDAIHMGEESHRRLAEAITEKIKEIFFEE
jgi:lysophospholipase L1-like esterase